MVANKTMSMIDYSKSWLRCTWPGVGTSEAELAWFGAELGLLQLIEDPSSRDRSKMGYKYIQPLPIDTHATRGYQLELRISSVWSRTESVRITLMWEAEVLCQ